MMLNLAERAAHLISSILAPGLRGVGDLIAWRATSHPAGGIGS